DEQRVEDAPRRLDVGLVPALGRARRLLLGGRDDVLVLRRLGTLEDGLHQAFILGCVGPARVLAAEPQPTHVTQSRTCPRRRAHSRDLLVGCATIALTAANPPKKWAQQGSNL